MIGYRDIVLLGGPCHRKKMIAEDSCTCVKMYSAPKLYWDTVHEDLIIPTSEEYRIYPEVKYLKGETIFVHKNFNSDKSKIIRKLKYIRDFNYDKKYGELRVQL